MPSAAYRRWRTVRAKALDEIAGAHAAVGGSARGRRYATQQINHAYAVLLAAQFQGFCRDLHLECVRCFLAAIVPSDLVYQLLEAEMTRGRQLDRANAQPSSLGADFGRFGMDFWEVLKGHSPASVAWKEALDQLNEWRNAIVHQDFTSAPLEGIMTLQLQNVRKWRKSCNRLGRAMEEVMRNQLRELTGTPPW